MIEELWNWDGPSQPTVACWFPKTEVFPLYAHVKIGQLHKQCIAWYILSYSGIQIQMES